MKIEFLTKKIIFLSSFIGLCYLLIVVYLMNFELVKLTLTGNYPIIYKSNLLIALLGGIWTAMTPIGFITLILTAILTGLNVSLLMQRILLLKDSGKLHFMIGGGSLLGVIGSGCAACGLPVISFFGLTSSVIYLPFRGFELSFIALFLLATSNYFLLRANVTVCNIKNQLTPSGSVMR